MKPLKDLFSFEKAIIGAIITIATLIALAFGVYFHFETKFVEAQTAQVIHQEMRAEIELTGIRLNAKILEDRISRIQERIWRYEEKYGTGCGEHRVLCQQWKAEIRLLELQLPGSTRR